MKYALAIVALLGMVSVEEVNALTRRAPVGVTFVQDSSDSSDSDDDLVQTHGDFFYARDIGTGPLDKKYERKVPEQFATGNDDLFMRSMIQNYAREGKTDEDEPQPNGVFSLTEASTRAAAAEVLATHKKLSGAALKDYLAEYFPRTWAHFDVNKEGAIGVEVAPQFMRFLASDNTLAL